MERDILYEELDERVAVEKLPLDAESVLNDWKHRCLRRWNGGKEKWPDFVDVPVAPPDGNMNIRIGDSIAVWWSRETYEARLTSIRANGSLVGYLWGAEPKGPAETAAMLWASRENEDHVAAIWLVAILRDLTHDRSRSSCEEWHGLPYRMASVLRRLAEGYLHENNPHFYGWHHRVSNTLPDEMGAELIRLIRPMSFYDVLTVAGHVFRLITNEYRLVHLFHVDHPSDYLKAQP